MTKWTRGPWQFERMKGALDMHKLKGTTPEPHEGYFRHNEGDFVVSAGEGPVARAAFQGQAKRGQAWCAPDPEGLANAHLIAAAPELYEALLSLTELLEDSTLWAGHVQAARKALAKARGESND